MRILVQWASTSHLTAMQQNDKLFVSPCVDVFALRHTLTHTQPFLRGHVEWWMWREGKWTQTSVASSAFSCQSSRTLKDLRHQCFICICVSFQVFVLAEMQIQCFEFTSHDEMIWWQSLTIRTLYAYFSAL